MDGIKPFLAAYLNPLPICVTLLAVGVLLLWLSDRTRAGRWLVTIGLVLLAVFGEGTLSSHLLMPLERQYQEIDPDKLRQDTAVSAPYVVVLSAGHVSDPQAPLARQITWIGLVRLIDGIRLHHALPGSKLVLSGDSAYDPVPEAAAMAKLAQELGVNPADLIVDTKAKNTEEQVQRVQAIVGPAPFMLVTSAMNMPRAMGLFEKAGLHPVPAPSAYYLKGHPPNESFNIVDHFPRAQSFRTAEHAIHEYLGMAWSTLRGQM
ncbi:ElyC/SanA/YdcF family protein [Nitrospira sp. Kam-Ns4a]